MTDGNTSGVSVVKLDCDEVRLDVRVGAVGRHCAGVETAELLTPVGADPRSVRKSLG